MMKYAEDRVSKFYNTIGWETEEGITEDARRWEDLREHAKEYVSKCRLRVLKHIPEYGENLLDMASGPIQYPEYLEYSSNFNKRYCIDLSSSALESAKNKIGDHGVFLHGSFFDILLEENYFDCAISLHTIYHIDKNKQEEAVKKLINITKENKPVIIVYSNPKTIFSFPFRMVRHIKNYLIKSNLTFVKKPAENLYFYSHPIGWWYRFSEIACVNILPWRSFGSNVQKLFFPNNKIGSKMFSLLFYLEEKFPDFFVKHFLHPMIILTKKKSK